MIEGLTENPGDRAGVFLVGAGHAEGALARRVDDFGVIDTEAVGDGGIQIVEGDWIFSHGPGVFVRLTVDQPTFDSTAREEAGEGSGMVASSVTMFFLDLRRPSEFGTEDDEGGVQQTSFLEIRDERAVGRVEQLAAGLHRGEVVVVGVPAAESNFDEAHAMFDESPGEETALPEGIPTVAVPENGAFLGEVKGGQIFALHDAHRFVEQSSEVFGIGRGIFAVEALVDDIGKTQTSFEVLFADGGMPAGSFESLLGIRHDRWRKFGTHPAGADHVGGAVHRDVSGEGVVLRALQTRDPTADCGVDDCSELTVALVKEVAGLVVVSLFRLHRVDRANLPHDLGSPGEVAGDLQPVCGGGDSLDGALDILAGLEVEGVDVAHPSRHVEEDDIGGSARSFRRSLITEGLGGERSSEHGGEAHAEESAGSIPEKFTTRVFTVEVEKWWVH